MKYTSLVILVLLAAGRAFGTGECGAQFLKMGVGARACGMGEAFTAVADDPSAVYWNQAGLAQLDRVDVLAMQNFWLLDMSYQYLALAVPSGIGTFGLSAAYSSSGTIPKYEDFQKTGDYTAYDATASLAYGRDIARIGAGDLGLGLGGRFIQQKIENEDAMGFAGDVGLLYRLTLFNVGLAVQNIGPGIKFIERADPLPLDMNLGASGRIGPVLLAADLGKYIDSKVRFGIGAEGTLLKVLALRAGYNTASSFSAGGGVTWHGISIDYAFVPYKDIDATHRISARVRF
jgi:hypothetical protein